MNKSNFRMVGPLKYITDFPAWASIYSETRGFCYKASTADGLVIVNIETGARGEVPSTEMFFEVEELKKTV